MGKTYRKEKQYKKARKNHEEADHGRDHNDDADHERTELRRQRQNIKRNWQDAEDGD